MFGTAQPRRLSFTIPEMFQQTVRIYAEHAVPLLILSTLVTVPLLLLGQLLLGGSNALTTVAATGSTTTAQLNAQLQSLIPLLIASLILVPILTLLQYVLVNGPISWLTSEYLLGERGIGFQAMFRGAASRLGSLAGGYFLLIVIAVIVFIGLTFLAVVCFPLGILIIPMIYLFSCINFVIAPVLMLERIDFAAALNRAWVLGKLYFWRALGLFFLIGLLGLLIQLPVLIVSWPTLVESARLGAQGNTVAAQAITQTPLQVIVSAVAAILILPLAPIASTVLYYDIRSRAEGLDIALETLGTSNARPHSLPSPMQGSGLNSRDFLNMFILLGLAVALVLLFFLLGLMLIGTLGSGLSRGFGSGV
jgi:hypothetical protein